MYGFRLPADIIEGHGINGKKTHHGKEITFLSLSDESRFCGYNTCLLYTSYLLGKKGVAETDLRPTGVGNFEGVNFDVISEGKYISKGTNLEIIKVNGSKLIVKEQ